MVATIFSDNVYRLGSYPDWRIVHCWRVEKCGLIELCLKIETPGKKKEKDSDSQRKSFYLSSSRNVTGMPSVYFLVVLGTKFKNNKHLIKVINANGSGTDLCLNNSSLSYRQVWLMT